MRNKFTVYNLISLPGSCWSTSADPKIQHLVIKVFRHIMLQLSLAMAVSCFALANKEHVQELTISGTVRDEVTNDPLPGVNILVKGTSHGTTTDANGRYSINVINEKSILSFSFIGFATQELEVGRRTEIDIFMVPDVKSLDEIVVVGYGEVKKSDLTGSVSSIKADEINAFPTTNLMQSLSGRAAGVQVTQNNGEPGGPISLRIRGTNSIQGSNEPLYVIDGFPYSGNPTILNPADIESIEVLKDASATAIYGSRGANGVVLITTKRGKTGNVQVDYEGYYGWQTPRKTIEMMSAKEYAQFYNEQATNDGLAPHFTSEEIDSLGTGTDWQDVVLRTAPIQNHAVTIKGGGDHTRFSVGASRFDQQGIIIGSDYIRNSLRTNISTDLGKKITFDLNAVYSRFNANRQSSGGGNRGGSLISAMLSGYPTIAPLNPDGTYTNLATAYTWGSNAIINPLNFVEQTSNHLESNKILTNASITFKPIDGLSVKVSGGLESTDDRTDNYQTKKFQNSSGNASIDIQRVSSVLNENTISYEKEFDDHNIAAVAGFTYQNYRGNGLYASGSGFVSDIQETFDIGAAATQGVPSSYYSDWTLLSYLGRVNYSFKGKYLATVSFRRDGSSRYSDEQKWGGFPSVAVAWRLYEENFIRNISIISDFKLRAGYGETGSTAINPYQTLNQLTSGKVIFGDALATYYAPGNRLPSPLKWETTAQTDIGFDIAFLNNRFGLTLDYYEKNTRDLLNTVALPSSLGYSYTIQNIGKVQNKGFELAANAVVFDGSFRWEVAANFSRNKNKIVKLYDGKDVLTEAINIAVINDNVSILREGEPIGSFFGYVENGYDENGFVVYQDFNESGSRDLEDKRIIGNPFPDFIYGFNSTMSFKNLELNIFIQGSEGNDVFNVSAVNQTFDYGQALNMPREVYNNHWTPDNQNAKYPKISRSSNPQVSDRFIEDGSYLRFKNIQISYNMPSAVINRLALEKAQIYVSGQNLITFTNYSWYDPEISSYGGANSTRLGVDHYSYPTAKSVTVGVRLGF